jgi:hypothetical protein
MPTLRASRRSEMKAGGNLAGQRRLLRLEQDAQNLLQRGCVRRARHLAVQPLLQQPIGAWIVDNVSHAAPPLARQLQIERGFDAD